MSHQTDLDEAIAIHMVYLRARLSRITDWVAYVLAADREDIVLGDGKVVLGDEQNRDPVPLWPRAKQSVQNYCSSK